MWAGMVASFLYTKGLVKAALRELFPAEGRETHGEVDVRLGYGYRANFNRVLECFEMIFYRSLQFHDQKTKFSL